MLLYPLRGHSLAWLLIMGVAALLFHLAAPFIGQLGSLLGAVWWLMSFKLASEALTGAASGRGDDASFENFSTDGVALRQVFLGLGLLAIGALLHIFVGPGSVTAFAVALALLLPAIVILLVMEDSLLRAFDPTRWFELFRRIGQDYLLVALKLTALAAAIALATVFAFAPMPELIAATLVHVAFLYGLLAGYRELGALLDRNREALELEVKEAISRPHTGAPDEDIALMECERLVAANKPAEGAAVLDRLIRGRGASAPTHARYRELLTGLGDTQGLLRHAQGYVAVLLGLHKEREAMALYLGSRAMYGEFELEEPQRLSDLIAIAARNQQSKLAVALAEEFARRFPRDRDLVLNGLTAAKLMDRLDRDEDARRLLLDLIARFPDHELRPELDAALAAIAPNPIR